MEFDPMQDVPADDEQAEIALRHGKAEVGDSLCGIYQCRRAMGATVLEAFEVALKAYLDAYEHAQQTRGKFTNEPTKQTWWAGYEYVDASHQKTNT